MRVIYCEQTQDINLILTQEEKTELKGDEYHTPIIHAENKGLKFNLMNTNSGFKESDPAIKVIPPKAKTLPYYIKINDSAYEELDKLGKCGTRYNEFSKINILIQGIVL